jgi:hypothetical protein
MCCKGYWYLYERQECVSVSKQHKSALFPSQRQNIRSQNGSLLSIQARHFPAVHMRPNIFSHAWQSQASVVAPGWMASRKMQIQKNRVKNEPKIKPKIPRASAPPKISSGCRPARETAQDERERTQRKTPPRPAPFVLTCIRMTPGDTFGR